MRQFIKSVRAALRFRDYRPMPLSFLSASRWTNQFAKKDRRLVGQLLDKVIYISESKTRDILVTQNKLLMKRLFDAGLPHSLERKINGPWKDPKVWRLV